MTTAHAVAPVSLYAEFTARPGYADEVLALITELARHVRGRDGNQAFEVHRLLDQSSKFFVYEVYETRRSFELHLASPANIEFNRRLGRLIEEPSSVLTWLA